MDVTRTLQKSIRVMKHETVVETYLSWDNKTREPAGESNHVGEGLAAAALHLDKLNCITTFRFW